ncbi:MAG: thioesterase family protein [Bryobacteraceae bacterium]
MTQIPIGLKGEHKQLVTPEVAVGFLGPQDARVLGTPYMILLLEFASRDSILPFLDPGYDSVGTEVNVRHLAATPLGMQVSFKSEVIAVEDRRVRFKIEAFDEKEKIGDGTHERFIIQVERFTKRLAEKRG